MMLAEVIAQPAAVTITVRRDMFTLIAAALTEVIDTVAILEDGASAADRLVRELRIARAEIARLELHATARDLDRISPTNERGSTMRHPLHRHRGEADVIDLVEVFRRERGAQPVPPDGGSAA